MKKKTIKTQVKAFKSTQIIYLGDCEVKHWDELNSNQLKIAMFSASKVQENDTGETKYIMKFKDFADLCKFDEDTSGGANYEKIYKECKKLARSGVDFINKQGKIIIFNWLDRVTIDPKGGKVIYYLDPRLLPFYKTQVGTFAIINLLDYMPLRGKYALMLFEFLAKWQNAGEVYQTIDQLRDQLRIAVNKYTQTRDFFNKVINPAVEEINAKTEYTFKVEVQERRGKHDTVEGINFVLKSIKAELEETLSPELAELVELLCSLGVERPAAHKLVKTFPQEIIISNIKFAKSEDKKDKRANFAGFLCRAISENWSAQNPKSSEKKPANPAGMRLLAKKDCKECDGEGGYYVRPTGTDDPWQWIPCRCTE